MMKKFWLAIFTLGLVGPTILVAGTPNLDHPCQQIIAACKGAGFGQSDATKGNGLWLDCYNPIMAGSKQPANADKPLPSVSAELVAACKVKGAKR